MQGEPVWGYLFQRLLIVISDKSPLVLQKETLLHELMHAALAATKPDLSVGDDVEEYAVSQLSPALFGVLRDNSKLTKWLLAE